MPLPIRTSTGGTANVATVTLPDGTIALLHMTADPASGAPVTPALDATLQGATTALQTIASVLTGRVKIDPGTF